FGRQTGDHRAGRASLIGLAVVFAVMAGALSFGVNLDQLVNDPARWGNNFDYAIGSGEESIAADTRDTLDASPDVGALTLYGTTSVSVGTTSLGVLGMQVVK